ncbi:MAG TPA: hypothetical protein VN956_11200 [Pyrinomonadaceae bacterium]|nr:hypothetical protein [Pyrinomonadaceae bacterium]
MLTKTLLILAVLCAAILIGCSKTDTMENSNTMANKPATMASPAKSTTASSGEKIGVPECDEYIAKYEACAGKVPEAGRAAYNSGLEQTRSAWKKLAANPATKGTLAAACKQATEAQAAAWKTYGCAN